MKTKTNFYEVEWKSFANGFCGNQYSTSTNQILASIVFLGTNEEEGIKELYLKNFLKERTNISLDIIDGILKGLYLENLIDIDFQEEKACFRTVWLTDKLKQEIIEKYGNLII